ncbi:MAG: tetratricopeptide repeat-containing sensor histidine kinase [Fulvivirga sp.]|nr:tetratricopeptide repeat-containing sensor histidine kinase [Fulvivirga sp.]
MKKAISLSLLLFVLSGQFTRAQNYSYIDSLYGELKKAEGIEKANLYLDIAWEYRKSHPDSTIYYSQKALDFAESMDMVEQVEAKSLNLQGVAYHYMGENIKSFDFYNEAIKEALKNKDSLQYAHSLNSMGRIYLNQGDFLRAYDNYFEALEIFEKLGDKKGIGYCYKSLSELYQTQENYQKALEMSEIAYSIRKETGNIHGQISILMEIAEIHETIGNYGKAFDYYLQAKIKAESIDDQINIAVINLGIATLYFKQEKYDESLLYAQKAYAVADDSRNKNLLSGILLQLGKSYYELGDMKKSLEYLQNTVKQAERSKELALLRDAHFFMSQIYRRQNDFEQAYDDYQEYADLNQALNSAEVARTIERFESRIEIDKKEQQNKLLLANQARDQAVIERQRIQNIALLIIALILLIFGINIFLTSRRRKSDNKKLQEKNERIAQQREEITKQNEQISEQNKKLKKRNDELAEINNEKNTLMNIVAHDLKSPFNRIKGLVELLKLTNPNDEQRNYINLLEDITKGSTDLIRDLLDVNAFEEDKRKPEVTKIDLHHLLLEKTKLFYADGKAKGIEIKTPTVENRLFFESDEVYLSRILDNLISNAVKFSDDNSEVVLEAGESSGNIYISIKDQGPGFSEEDKKHLYKKFKKLSARPTAGESSNGLGLAIVKTLVERLDGEIILKSEKEVGSEFIIKFPSRKEVSATSE